MTIDALRAAFSRPGTVAVEAGRNGMPRFVLTHSSGSRVEVYLHGAHVVSWRGAAGNERLFLSERSQFQATRPIRGGIPIVFPQFGGGPLPPHGFARTSPWQAHAARVTPDGETELVLQLRDAGTTLELWPHPFLLTFTIRLGTALTLALDLHNRGSGHVRFQAALHTYFAIADIRQATVSGLKAVTRVDTLRENAREKEERETVGFAGETDLIYAGAPDRLTIRDPAAARTFTIAKSGMPDVVVWNPWIEKARRMPDFGDDEYARMLCVETGIIDAPMLLAPDQTWRGITRFEAEP